MLKRQKTKSIIAKQYRNRREISFFNKKKRNYENNIRDNMDLNKAYIQYKPQF